MDKDQIKGRVNEAVGKATGDEKKELKGKAQKHFGDTKENTKDSVDNAADKLNDKIDDAERKHDRR